MTLAVPLWVMTLTGMGCAGLLVVAARLFAVEEDPRIETVANLLPGINCGGCGYAGCWDYAKALVQGHASPTTCGPGGPETAQRIASALGLSMAPLERQVAIVLCGGDDTLAVRKFRYNGLADCTAAALIGGGEKRCTYGCLGYGNCARVCPVAAIAVTPHRLAVVDPHRCIGCSACVRTCPRGLIRMVPVSRRIHVLCRSKDSGPFVRGACQVGCIGCSLCTRLADPGAIRMEGALAVVDYEKPLTRETVVEKCPGHCIVKR